MLGALFVLFSLGVVAIEKGSSEENIEILLSLAEEGNADAQYKLGGRYLFGSGLAQDYVKAREWLEKSAAQNNSDAQWLLGGIYYDPIGVEQDYVKAREWFEKSAAQNNPKAQYFLGAIYEEGLGVKKDYVKARELYEKSAAQNDSYSLFKLGFYYHHGLGVTQDYVKAREWYEKAAKLKQKYAIEALEDIVFIALSEGGIEVKASQLHKAYSENEVRASLTYDGFPLVLEGKIDSIGFAPITNRPLLRFTVPTNRYFPVQAVFSKEYTESLADMKKGEIVKVVCSEGVSYSLGSIAVHGCVVP